MIQDHPAYKVMQSFLNEPDTHIESYHGLEIYMARNFFKAWCGYVRVPEGHPLHEVKYSDRIPVADRGSIEIRDQSPMSVFIELSKEDDGKVCLDMLLDCPGGVTFSGTMRDREGWWLGFDCNHYNDISPRGAFYNLIEDSYCDFKTGEYRTYDFVLAATRKLANQIKEYKPAGGPNG